MGPRVALCLVLLSGASLLAQGGPDGTPEAPVWVRLLDEQNAENRRLQTALDDLAAQESGLEARRKALQEKLDDAREKYDRFVKIYRGDGGDERPPSAAEVRIWLDRLDTQSAPSGVQADLRELDRLLVALQSQRDQAAEAKLKIEDEFAALRARAKAEFEAAEQSNWKTQATRWDDCEERRRELVDATVPAAEARAKQVAELRAIRQLLHETRRNTLYLLRRKNLLLRGRSDITIPAIRTGLSDLRRLPGWLAARARGVLDYVASAEYRTAIGLLLGGVGVALLVLLLARRRLRSGADAMARQSSGRALARLLSGAATLLARVVPAATAFLVPYLASLLLPDLPTGAAEWLYHLGVVLGGALLARLIVRTIVQGADRPGARLDPESARLLARGLDLLVWISVIALPPIHALEDFRYGNRGVVELLNRVYEVLVGVTVLAFLLRRRFIAGLLPKAETAVGRLVHLLVRLLRPLALLLVPTLLVLSALRFDILAGLVTRFSVAAVAAAVLASVVYRLGQPLVESWARSRHPPAVNEDRYEAAAGGSGFLLRLSVFFAAVWLFLRLSGSDLDELRGFFDHPLPLQRSTEGAITWWNVIGGTFLLLFFVYATKHVKAALHHLVLDRTSLDEGVKYTTATLVGYVLLGFGAYVAVREVFDLSNLGYIVAALSVGIGFGLQEIISNFVSGLILLFERPLKVGDLVEVGTSEGIVKQINIRATTVLTRDNVYLMVPNREFISQTVVNFAHKDPKVRLRIAVGVSYASDPKVVKETLLDVARKQREVLDHPTPDVWFVGFGDSSLNFELLVWISRPPQKNRIASDLHFAIFEAFAEKGIQIPFPQRDLHLRSAVPFPLESAAEGAEAPDAPEEPAGE